MQKDCLVNSAKPVYRKVWVKKERPMSLATSHQQIRRTQGGKEADKGNASVLRTTEAQVDGNSDRKSK